MSLTGRQLCINSAKDGELWLENVRVKDSRTLPISSLIIAPEPNSLIHPSEYIVS